MKYTIPEPENIKSSGCGSAADCATRDIMESSSTQNKINQLGGVREHAPTAPNVVGATEEQNNIFAKVAKLSVQQQENAKFDNDVGKEPLKGGGLRKRKFFGGNNFK